MYRKIAMPRAVAPNITKIFKSLPFQLSYIGLLIALLYGRSLFFGFTSLDDVHLIRENSANIGTWENIPKAFRTDVYWNNPGTYYRPVLSLSFMVDHALGGDRPFFYHLTNVLLHLVGCALLLTCLLSLGYGKGNSFLFSMIFAVHPALSQAVGWIPGRNDTLLCIFVLSGFFFLLKYLHGCGKRWMLLHLAAFWTALFTKEAAIFAPVLFMLYAFLIEKVNLKIVMQKVLPGWAAIIVLWLVMRWYALGTQGVLSFRQYAGWPDIIIGLLSYIGKIFFPLNLSVLPLSGDINPIFGIAGLMVLILFAWAKGIKNVKMFSFGAAWLVLFLLPTFIPITNSINFLEHRLYLPILGVIIMLAESRALRDLSLKKAAISTAVVVSIFMLINIRHTGNFYDGIAFWGNAAKTSPHSGLGHQMQGRMYFKSGMIEKAQQEYMLSLEIEDNASVHNDLALLSLRKGDLAGAENEFKRVMELDPGYANIHNNLALVFFQTGRYNDAKRELLESSLLGPRHSEPLINLGVLYLQEGVLDSAETFLRRSLEIDDKNAVANHHLGIALTQTKKYTEALTCLTKAVESSPGDPLINLHLAQLYLIMRNVEKAEMFYQRALRYGCSRNDLLENNLKNK
jgi:Tfp pilus assembly protein PilF